jgi:hypothetical protein
MPAGFPGGFPGGMPGQLPPGMDPNGLGNMKDLPDLSKLKFPEK